MDFGAKSIVAVIVVGLLSATCTRAAPRQLPALRWEVGSDWVSVKAVPSPGAVGDGQADDTAAIQTALDALRDGSVLYFPPGVYRITAPLRIKNSTGVRWLGGLMIGSGRDTKLVWDGGVGPMFLLDGVAYSRFVGFELDGGGKAGAGFHYQATQGFQTEVTHRHLAFRGFTNAAILESHPGQGQALAETTFENCLFEDCQRGVAFLQFNDYDYTFDGCEFRRCGVAIDCAHGNFYVRNCHFENSRIADVRDLSEHCSSIRRSTSAGSQVFVLRQSSIAPLTIQDCQVDGWQNRGGAILLSRPPVLLFDCVFTNPPRNTPQAGLPPVHLSSDGQYVLTSQNEVRGAASLFQGARPMEIKIPAGQRSGVIHSASQTFLGENARIPGRLFDARRDFGAKGDGRSDDTMPIQKTIDAAAATSARAIAYLPTGRYVITSSLRVMGTNYFFGGSGWNTRLIWKGPEGGAMIVVKDPQEITMADLMVGSHDAGAMNNGIDIEQTGSARPSRITYDGVYVYGIYQKAALRKGFRFSHLTEKDVVVMPHVQGNLRFVNCGRATVLANCSYEGSVVIEGKEKGRDGLIGFQTRLATIVTYGLYLRDNNNIVMSDFYVEQADNGYWFEGEEGDPPGRATLTGAKFHSFTSPDPSKNNLIDIRDYQGQIFIGPYQFYQEPKRMRIRQKGVGEVQLFIYGSSWYGAAPDPQLTTSAKLLPVGNEFYGSIPDADSVRAGTFFKQLPSDETLSEISGALDDLRRLGEIDQRLNHP